jgi:hypothetical protein
VAAMELYSAGNGGIRGRERERWLSLEVAATKAREGVREVRQHVGVLSLACEHAKLRGAERLCPWQPWLQRSRSRAQSGGESTEEGKGE